MSVFESLPYDILIAVGKACAKPDLNNLAKANSLCYDVFNPLLYSRNIKDEAPHKSCLFFAIRTDNIDTIQKALEHGADVNTRALKVPAAFLPAGQEDDDNESGEYGEGVTEDVGVWDYAEPAEEDAVDSDQDGSLVVGMSDTASFQATWDMTEAEYVFEVQATTATAAPKLSYTPLQCATLFRRHEIIKYLLQHGADLDETTQASCDCLDEAEEVGIIHIVLSHGEGDGKAAAIAKTLIEHGARDSAKGYPAIFEIVKNADIELFDVMVNLHEVDIHATDKSGRNLLHLAVDSYAGACLPLCRKLLDRGVAVNHRDNMGRTPFSSMAMTGDYVTAAILLLEHEADPTLALVYRDGTRPQSMLDVCIYDIMDYPSGIPWQAHAGFVKEQTERTQLVKLLLESGLPPNPRQGSRRHRIALTRALFGAAAHLKDVNCMQMLINAGARADSTIEHALYRDQWPLLVAFVKHEARQWGRLTFDDIPEEISMVNRVRLLLDHGAPLDPVDSTDKHGSMRLLNRPLADESEGGAIMQLDESDEEIEGTRDPYSIQGFGSDLSEFSEGLGISNASAIEVAFELAASDRQATFRPEVGFKLNDIFLDIFCEYATSRNITEEHICDLIEYFDEEEYEDTSSGKEPSGRMKAAWDKLVQLRDRVYPGH